MSDHYGSDFITIVDEDGTEFELEVLTTVEYNGAEYLAVVPAVDADEDVDLEVWTALIGNDAIQMLPGEVFARFGLQGNSQCS